MQKVAKPPKQNAQTKVDRGIAGRPEDKVVQDAKEMLIKLLLRLVSALFAFDASECPERCHLPHEVVIYVYCAVLLCLQQYNVCHTNFFAYNWYAFGFALLALTKRLAAKCAQHIHTVAAHSKAQEVGKPQVKTKGPYTAIQTTTQQGGQFIKKVAVALYGILTMAMLYCFWNMIGAFSPWRLHFLFYPYFLYWIWVRPSFVSPTDSPTAHAGLYIKYWLYSSLCCTYYATLVPLLLVPDPALHYSPVRCWTVVGYCLANVAVLLLLQGSFRDLGLNVARANASLGPARPPQASEKKGRSPSHDGGAVAGRPYLVQYRGHHSQGHGWPSPGMGGGWAAALHSLLFRDADRCPRTLVLLQTFSTFSLLPIVFYSYHWPVYAVLLTLNYPLLWWTVHIRRRLLMQTLSLSRQLARQTKAVAGAPARDLGPEGAAEPKPR
eukprot:EG_transcript_13208